MILIADGGSTKADWIALSHEGQILFQTRSAGINPEILTEGLILNRLSENVDLIKQAENFTEIFFYGAGCGSQKAKLFLQNVLSKVFVKAKINVAEDMLAAVYAASSGTESIVCILGTGSNSCYFDGKSMHQICPSLGYMVMDEASANLFGRRLLRDYFYQQMPNEIRSDFESKFNLDADIIKENMYKKDAPNAYLGDFSKIMFDHKNTEYIINLVKDGFREFYKYRIMTFEKAQQVPVFFIGSIAYFFSDLLEEIAEELEVQYKGSIQRPIENLIHYHQTLLKK